MISDWGFNYDLFKLSGLRDTEQIFVIEGRVWRWILEFQRQHRNRIGIAEREV